MIFHSLPIAFFFFLFFLVRFHHVCEPSEMLLRSIFMLRFFVVFSFYTHNTQRGIRSYKFFFTTPNVDRGKTIQRPIAAFSYVSFNSDFFSFTFLFIRFLVVLLCEPDYAHTKKSLARSLSLTRSGI